MSTVTILLTLLIGMTSGQLTMDNNFDNSPNTELEQLVIRLRNELESVKTRLETRLDAVEREMAELLSVNQTSRNNQTVTSGQSYIRWGRTTCEGDATVIYKGYAAGPHYDQGGGGSNFVCVGEEPQWLNRSGPTITDPTGRIYGVEYEIFTNVNDVFRLHNNGGNPLANMPAPCVACYAASRSSVLMIPARTQCPAGWTKEYHGYLVSETSLDRHRSSYVCWDEAPEISVGSDNQNQCVIYPVRVGCGSLPCSKFTNDWVMTCVVCSK